jgi:hypothetical protein
MKVEITTKKELQNPHLEININLEIGSTSIVLKYTCPTCSGYGCHNRGGCDNTIRLEPEDVLHTLGPDNKRILQDLFKTILDGGQ